VPRSKRRDRAIRLPARPGRLVSFVLTTVLLSSGLIAVAPAFGAQSEDQVKAAFLFNFARYVEWPVDAFADASQAVRICMLGTDGFAQVVSRAVSGKSVGDRAVEVDLPGDLESLAGCHILYVGDRVEAGPREIADRVGGASVFTVADRAGFARGGGVANFIRADNRIRFEINPGAAKRAGLKISSRLLRLAKVVE
jgi:hypothetical protein